MDKMNPSFLVNNRKPPKSKISDLLPSNIIDEIEISTPPKETLSYNKLLSKGTSQNTSKSAKYSSDSTIEDVPPKLHHPKVQRKVYSSSKNLMYSNLNNQFTSNSFKNINNFSMVNNNIGYNDCNNNNNNTMGLRIPIQPRTVYSDQYNMAHIMNRGLYDGKPNNQIIAPFYINNNRNNSGSNCTYLGIQNNNYGYSNVNGNINANNSNNSFQHNHNFSNYNHQNQALLENQVESCITQLQQFQFQYGQLNQGQGVPFPISILIEKTGPTVFLQLIKTSKGSRFFQKILSNSPPTQTEIDLVLQIITINIEEVICDYYGNYFLQKFLPYCSFKHRILLYSFIKPNFLFIANDICGNHSLQSLIMLQNSKEEENIIKECLENNLDTLTVGANSSHVVEKVIKVVKEPNRDYINTYIISNLIDLCLDSHGICVVKEFIDNTQSECYIKAIISIFELETNKLTYDQYGNFGIQEVIKVYGFIHCKKIISKIVDHIVEFSVFKFSSNVVDFVIDYLRKKNFSKFCHALNKIFVEETNLSEMLKSKYATYVIENCLCILDSLEDEENLSELKEKIIASLNEIPNVKEKKKIYKFLKNMNEKNKMNNNNNVWNKQII